MLVLSRKFGEEILIGSDVRIAVVEIRGDKVRLGIDAPRDMPVNRREIWEAKEREREIRESKERELSAREWLEQFPPADVS